MKAVGSRSRVAAGSPFRSRAAWHTPAADAPLLENARPGSPAPDLSTDPALDLGSSVRLGLLQEDEGDVDYDKGGDVQFTAFLTPVQPMKGWIPGAGPVLRLPTATDARRVARRADLRPVMTSDA